MRCQYSSAIYFYFAFCGWQSWAPRFFGFFVLSAFVGVVDRVVHLPTRIVLGASLLLILLGILLKGRYPNNIVCNLRRKVFEGPARSISGLGKICTRGGGRIGRRDSAGILFVDVEG